MSELIPIYVFSMAMAIVSHRASEYDSVLSRYGKKDLISYTIMAIGLIVFCGLRTLYNDTWLYVHMYESIQPDVGLFEGIDWLKIGENPGFTFLNRLLRKLGFSVQSYLMFYSLVTNGIFLWFIRKYSRNIPFSIFLFLTFDIYLFTLAAIKQCMAMVLCVLATDRAIRGKRPSFVCWVLVASLFHPYAIMFLVVPLLTFRPWSLMTYVMLVAFVAVGFLLDSLLGTLVDITSMMGKEYTELSLSGSGINPARLGVTFVPVVLSYFTRGVIAKENDRIQNLILNLATLNAAIMFVALFGDPNYFGRLANYFLPFQIMTLPWLLTQFEYRSRRLLTSGAVVGYSLFFIYSNYIQWKFNDQFSSITIWEYIRSLL